jgi:diguanylate cyclase (GGDEF)-like protein
MEKNLWIAIAIQKQRTFELEVLTQMSNALQSCLHEQETYEVVINACKQTLPGSSGCLCLLNDSQKTMRTAGTWGKISPQPKIFNVNDCVELRQNNHHTPLSSSCNDGFCQHMAFPSESIHWCIPLKTPEEILGVLHLSIPPSSKNGISEKDEEILQLQNMAIMRIAEQYVLSLANLRLREKLEVEAVRDPLTGLYNRRYMEASLKREWARAERRSCTVAILMLDIDHFKKVNDTYGHNVGDIVLQELGSLLQRHIRTEDIACRYGGEEFLLIMPEISLEIAKYRAEELRVMIKELRISYQKILLTITVSIGIALFPTHGNNLNDVIHTADAALYRAKKGGRDRVEIALA